MAELPVFVAGLVAGVMLAAVAMMIRRRSVVDLGAGQQPAAAPRSAESSSSASGEDAAVELGGGPSSSIEATPRGFRLSRTKVLRRISARLEPGGTLNVTVDGVDYHRLEDIPDEATRDQVRGILKSLPGQVADPAARAKVENELRDAGIDGPTDT
jgi:hypothetical protein